MITNSLESLKALYEKEQKEYERMATKHAHLGKFDMLNRQQAKAEQAKAAYEAAEKELFPHLTTYQHTPYHAIQFKDAEDFAKRILDLEHKAKRSLKFQQKLANILSHTPPLMRAAYLQFLNSK